MSAFVATQCSRDWWNGGPQRREDTRRLYQKHCVTIFEKIIKASARLSETRLAPTLKLRRKRKLSALAGETEARAPRERHALRCAKRAPASLLCVVLHPQPLALLISLSF